MKAEFVDLAEKGAFVQNLVNVATTAMTDADKLYANYDYKQAQAEYVVASDGYLHLMKITRDDANFQKYLK